MFITKSEKQSMVEVSLNLGAKLIDLTGEVHILKNAMKKAPSWKWVEILEKGLLTLEKRVNTSIKTQSSSFKNHRERIEILENRFQDLNVVLESLLCFLREIESGEIKPEKSTQELVIAKKRGRPLGSKAKRPKFPPKTPFELKKPLGRPKGSKNKAK